MVYRRLLIIPPMQLHGEAHHPLAQSLEGASGYGIMFETEQRVWAANLRHLPTFCLLFSSTPAPHPSHSPTPSLPFPPPYHTYTFPLPHSRPPFLHPISTSAVPTPHLHFYPAQHSQPAQFCLLTSMCVSGCCPKAPSTSNNCKFPQEKNYA